MNIWKRLLGTALCLCLCVELLPVTARAAATLPVIEIGTSGTTYQYAESGTNRTQLAYGKAASETPISKAAFETGDGGTRFTLDTGWDRNFKLIYREIPVTVTVPANTEYTVMFSYIFKGSYHQPTGQTTAKFAAQAIYLGENGASADVLFHTAAGSGVKTTRGGSEVANVHSVTITNGNNAVEKPGSSNGSVFTAKFRNDTAAPQDITRYFGCWAACGDGSENPSSMTLRFTLTPVTAAYTLTLDPDGGNVSPASKQVTLGGQYGELPTPTKTGFTFIGWYTEKTGGTKVGRYDSLVSNASHTLYARWSQNHTHEAVPGESKTFDGELNTGTYQLNTYYWLSQYDNYYLTTTFTSSYQLKVPSNKAKYICLNGKTFTSNSSHRVSFSGNTNIHNGGGGFGDGSVYICDCGGSGGIINTYGSRGMVFRVESGSLYLYGGTFRAATAAAVINGSLLVDGAALYATDTAINDFGSYTTIIKSGIVSSSGAQAVYADKSSDYNGFFYVRGGTIENTGEGCAICVGDKKTVHLSGSPTITGKSCDILLEKNATVTVDGALTGVFSVGLDDPATVTAGTPVTIAVGKDGGNPAGHFVLPDGEAYKDLYLKEGTDNGKPIVQVCRYDHTHSGGTATCTEWGECTGCGTAYLKPLGHAIEKHDGKDPTCTETGWWAYETCSRCDYTTYQKIPANGHKYGALVLEKPATCTAEGMRAHYQCADCKTLFSTNMQPTTPEELKISLIPHSYGEFQVDKPATCTENGSKSKYCAVCKKQAEVTAIPATGHKPVTDAAVPPTCTQTGLTLGKHCSVCNTVLTPQTIVPALEHQWNDGIVTREPTCTEAGVKTFTCSQCHNTKTEPLAALEHNYGEPSYAWNGTSCTAEQVCSRDGSHKEMETVIAAVTVTQNKDCVSDELSTYTASFQNTAFATQTQKNVVTASKLGHDFKNGTWQSDGDHHWKKCSRCDVTDEANKVPHNWDTGVIKTQPTCTTAGEKTFTCTVCSVTRTETVSATGHNWSGEWMHNDTHHWHNCKNANCPVTENSKKSGYGPHSGGTANCTQQAVCASCGTAYGDLDANGHDWGAWAVTTPATTSAKGVETRTCQRNTSHTETRDIPKLTPVPSGGESSSAPAITVPVSGSSDTVHVSASVSGSTAEVKEIKSAELDKIGTDSAVVIDLSGLNKGVTGVTLSTDTIDSICKTEADGVTIKLPNAELRVDRQTLAAVIEQAAGSKIRLVVEPDSTARGTMTAAQRSTLAGMKNAAALEAYFVSNGTRIHDFKGGSVELIIPYRAEGAIRAWFLKEDGTREPVSARYDKENVQLILHHFSHYVIEELDSSAAYTVCPKDDSCPLGAFGDLTAAAWYHDGVHYCLENGLMRGVSGGTFLPDGSTTRAQLVTILWRLEGSPETTGAAGFGDTAGGAWYTEAVRWAAGCGVVKGYDNGHFGPNDAVTREQMAAILYRYAQHKGYDVSAGKDTNILSFDDAFAVSEYAIPAMQWACGSGMVRGIAQKGGMLLAPRDTTTRAQTATLLMRFQSAFAKAS